MQVTVCGRCFFHWKAFALPRLGISANSRICLAVTLIIFLLSRRYTRMTTKHCYHIKKHFKMNDHFKSIFQKHVRATQMTRAASMAVTLRHLFPEHAPGGRLLDQCPQPQGSRAVPCEGGRTARQILAPSMPPTFEELGGHACYKTPYSPRCSYFVLQPRANCRSQYNVQTAEYFSLESHSQKSLGSPWLLQSLRATVRGYQPTMGLFFSLPRPILTVPAGIQLERYKFYSIALYLSVYFCLVHQKKIPTTKHNF